MTELAVRKGRITAEKAHAFLESLADLPIEIEHPSMPLVFVYVRTLASLHKLTAYDAAYLEMAVRHNLPIASSDKALVTAADGAGVRLVQL